MALATAGAAVLVAAVALQGVILELWTIHFELRSGEDGRQRVGEGEWDRIESRQRAAIRWLAARRSSLAAPYLLEIAGGKETRKREQRQGEISIQEEAEYALRQIPLGEDWYLARIRTGSEGARRLAIRILGDLGGAETVRRLQVLAAEDSDLPGLEAARSIARILPALEVEAVSDSAGPLRVARLRLTNSTPRSVRFRGESFKSPNYLMQERRGGEWFDLRKKWCVAAAEDPELLPRCSTVFKALLPKTSNPLRIGISLEVPDRMPVEARLAELHRTAVWSPEILPPQAPVPRSPDT